MVKKLNSIKKADYINNNLKRYIKSTFQIDDHVLNEQFNQSIDTEDILKGPYISGRLPFVEGASIRDLINEGTLSNEFLKMSGIKLDRPLYKHQEEAIRKSKKNMNLVVSTGTGSGKTESFLIPILNEIAQDIEKGIANRGIQALLLYPLNALANDQRSRVREILKDYPDITFGFFTGETKEKENEARKEYLSEFGNLPPINEIISREISREIPPNILFTNYSMLEFLLIRPSDESLFSAQNTRYWKYIVLDEAHTYVGALGIEISYLIKRLLGSINSKPKFILTSATLASDANDYPAVVDFANKLTSNSFTNESIIISKHQHYRRPKSLTEINPEVYGKLSHDDSTVKEMYQSNFNKEPNLPIVEMVRDLLLHSVDFFKFINFLEKPIKAEKMIRLLGPSWNDQYLSDYLDLLAKINTQSSKILFDVSYHSFIKTLDGAYVSLKPFKKLHLKKTSVIRHGEGEFSDEVVALQLGLCKYCSIPYVLGHIVDNRFHQIDDEDLYEIYGEENNNSIDILLIKEFVKTGSIDMEKKVEYVLCNKCGIINDKEVINPVRCNCGVSYQVELIGNDTADSSTKSTGDIKTNIHKCLSCESINNLGVVNSFYIGKDSATTIIAQLLYQSMAVENKSTQENTMSPVLNPFLRNNETSSSENLPVKQYITFSDSRQQASFFALFFENQHIDFLRKKLVLEAIRNKREVSIDTVQNSIQYRLENEDLLPKKVDLLNQGWISILIELLDVNRKFSLSGLGQLSFNYSLGDLVSSDDFTHLLESAISDKEVIQKLSYDNFNRILMFILNSMRRIPAVHYKDRAQLDFETRAEHLSYRSDDRSGLVLASDNKEKYQTSLLPYNKSGNIYTSYIMRSLNLSFEQSKIVLDLIWNYLNPDFNPVITANDSGVNYNINIDKITVSDGQYVDWYQCPKCKVITELNLNDTCISRDCEGRLVEIDIDEVMAGNFYVQEYKTKIIEKIVIEEHTAQINNKEARRIQQDFTEGKINILSSSTTFEMGVDVGSLDTVYMRNVPPLPANYVQRAGRAGRTKDTAAFVITFASNSSHDYTFFEDPLKMIDGKIKAPYFDLNNSKIANRHITSFALARFFKKYPEYFKDSQLALDEEVLRLFFEFVEMEKDIIIEFVENNKISSNFRAKFPEWLEENILSYSSKIRAMYHNHSTKIKQLEDARSEAIDSRKPSDWIMKTLQTFKSQSMLKTLAQYSVIPSYGFPVDSVSLSIPNNTNYKLDRDLSIAISEYAPSSEIIVEKMKYTSRYINVGGKKSLPNYFYVKCNECMTVTHSLNENDIMFEQCKNCLSDNLSSKNKFIIPINGFTTELESKMSKRLKPKKTYSSDYYYVGNEVEYLKDITFRKTLRLKTSKDTELAVLNENNFYMCNTCGYTDLASNTSFFPSYDKEHLKPGSIHSCQDTRLNKCSLGHTFYTDVVIFDIVSSDYTEKEIRSFMFALLEGISISLEIERRDINGIVQQIEGRPQIILFDTVPGGAGHVSRLLDESILSNVLTETLNKVNQSCCDESSSCYNCIRNFSNQRIHPFLKRGEARLVAHDIQSLFNKNLNTSTYSIENDAIEVESWKQLNSMFDNDFLNLETLNLELPSNAYSDLILDGKRYEGYLIWEADKVAVIPANSLNYDPSSDWKLFTLNEIDKLIEHLEVYNG